MEQWRSLRIRSGRCRGKLYSRTILSYDLASWNIGCCLRGRRLVNASEIAFPPGAVALQAVWNATQACDGYFYGLFGHIPWPLGHWRVNGFDVADYERPRSLERSRPKGHKGHRLCFVVGGVRRYPHCDTTGKLADMKAAAGGSRIKVYAYTEGNPVTYTDPLGLFIASVDAACAIDPGFLRRDHGSDRPESRCNRSGRNGKSMRSGRGHQRCKVDFALLVQWRRSRNCVARQKALLTFWKK